MFVRHFCSSCFLQNVLATDPFQEFCRQRGIEFDATLPGSLKERLRLWIESLKGLPLEAQAQVELDLARVRGLASPNAIAQLLRATEGMELPPDTIPGDTGLALWFFLKHPDPFHEVFLNLATDDVDGWWNAQAVPGVRITNFSAISEALGASLRDLFRQREGLGRFCAVDGRSLDGAYCFAAHIADRLQFLEVFTEEGEFTTQALQPALPVLFLYYPLDGTVLLQTRLTARDRILELFQLFGRVVLGAELSTDCMDHGFDLERLKERFDPLPDASDMELVRVKTIHFRYPERFGRRQVKLETLLSDEKFAIYEMIQTHMREQSILRQAKVSHAELQVKLKVDGGSKSYVIQLWPNRSSLNQDPLCDRLRACLKNWGLYQTYAA